MAEIVKAEKNELVSQEDIDFLIWFDEQKKRAKVIEDKVKNAGHQFLEDKGLLDTGYQVQRDGARVHIYETKAYKKKQIDTNKLKEEGLYDLYVKDVWVKGSVRIQVEYED